MKDVDCHCHPTYQKCELELKNRKGKSVGTISVNGKAAFSQDSYHVHLDLHFES